MTLRLLTFLALLAPLPAFAACNGHDDVAMSCAEGTTLDPETGTCVETPST